MKKGISIISVFAMLIILSAGCTTQPKVDIGNIALNFTNCSKECDTQQAKCEADFDACITQITDSEQGRINACFHSNSDPVAIGLCIAKILKSDSVEIHACVEAHKKCLDDITACRTKCVDLISIKQP